MNGDHETQESTEELTTYMIKNSKEIMELLERDNIKVDEDVLSSFSFFVPYR